MDESLKDFEVVYPSASTNSAVKMAPEEILEVTKTVGRCVQCMLIFSHGLLHKMVKYF